ncbi:MAG: PfkB family carbohydrate kinase [Opitutus sp.]
MTTSNKHLNFESAPAVFAGIRSSGKRIVQCHGTFDLIHPGHIIHFEEAKTLGDVLVVTVTGEEYVNKGPGRPYFNDEMRAKWLTALECVDYVVLIPFPAAVEAIECVRPHIYCKGKEYADTTNDVTGNILDDVVAARRCGGEVAYVGSVVFSSSRLLNQHFDAQPAEVKDYCRQIANSYPPAKFRDVVNDFSKLKVLIIGDVIFDRYTTVAVQGLTSKSRILSGRWIADDMQAGGALAVYRHIREFTPHVKLISLLGAESWLGERLGAFIPETDADFVRSPNFTTVVKQRFVEPRVEGKELAKLFSVNFIDRDHPGDALQRAVLAKIAAQIDDYDLVLVMDFGHGLMEDSIRDFVQSRARFLAVNCQTNSNNHGFNILNRRYGRADSFSLDLTEMMLAVGRRDFNFRSELTYLGKALGSKYAWLTRGSVETLGRKSGDEFTSCAPFERVVVDPLGAGDAFCAVASLAAVQGLPIDLATFMGQLAGAQAVKVVGNAEPIRKAKFLKGAEAMLAF